MEGSIVRTLKFSLVWILLMIIGSAQNHASIDDCTVHYYIAFEHNALPALIWMLEEIQQCNREHNV